VAAKVAWACQACPTNNVNFTSKAICLAKVFKTCRKTKINKYITKKVLHCTKQKARYNLLDIVCFVAS